MVFGSRTFADDATVQKKIARRLVRLSARRLGWLAFVWLAACTGLVSKDQAAPESTASPIASAAVVTIGETNVLTTDDSGNAGLLLVQDANLSQSATIQSISFYVRTAGGDLRLGIYDATGPSGGPGALKAQTNAFTPVTGWNTQNVITQVSLPAGNYWLAYTPSSSNLHFAVDYSSGQYKYASFAFGAMPSVFPSVAGQGVAHWSLYATLDSSSGSDTTPPSVSISAPQSGASLSGNVTVNAAASDNVGVAGVQFLLDGANLNAEDTSAPYSITWNTRNTQNGSHTLAARARDAAGNVTTSAAISVSVRNGKRNNDSTAPSRPTNLTATPVSTTQINLAWSASTDNVGVTGYRVFRDGVQIATATGTSYSNTGLTAATTYTYAIAAVDAAGNVSSQSATASATTFGAADTTPPSTPTNLTATAVSSTQINLAWSASTDNVGVVAYRVFRNGVQSAMTTGTTFSDTGLSAATTYTYTVAALDAAGNMSGQSATATATTFNAADTTPPSTPTSLSATGVSSSEIDLAWTASTDNVGVAGYKIFRNGTQVATSATRTYADTGLASNTSYSYTVSAYDAAGNVSALSTPASGTTRPVAAGAPTLIQHVASSANPIGLGISGNNFKIPLPNNVGAGNALVLGITYPHGASPTVTDSNGNNWPSAAAVSADAGAGGYVASAFVLANAKAGRTVIAVSFSSAVIPFNYTVSEFSNIASVSPVNGSSASAGKPGSAVSTGSMTPGNNDANGGNLIWNYYAISENATGNPSSWVAGPGFTLLDADIAWTTRQGFPHASQYSVQTTAAAVNPSITTTGDTSDKFNAIAVALKAASGGTAVPHGIHINKIIHQTSNVPPSGTWTLQEPATGNLRVLATAQGNNLTDLSSVTDNAGGTWIKVEPQADEPQIWYSANTAPNPNLTVTLHQNPVSTMTVLFYDISGAASSPFDVVAGAPWVDVSNKTVVNNLPNITPTTNNGLVIAVMGDGNGPGLGLASGSPSGAFFDLVNYAGETDLDLMENADGQAHLYNTSTTPLTWNWLITANPNNSVTAMSVAFKAAP